MKLPEKILYCRKRAGLSQEALAERLGVSRQAVSKWETGEALPETGKLATLAAALGASVDWLAGVYYALLGLFTSGMGALLLSLALRLRQDVRTPFKEIGLGHLFDQPGIMYYDIAHNKTYILCIVLIALGTAVFIAGTVSAVWLKRRSRR